MERTLFVKLDRIGLSGTSLTFNDPAMCQQEGGSLDIPEDISALEFLLDWLEKQAEFASVMAIGHRVVHGMERTAPELVTTQLLAELHRISSYDPEHLPREIDRKSVVSGKSVSGRVALGGRRIIKKKK